MPQRATPGTQHRQAPTLARVATTRTTHDETTAPLRLSTCFRMIVEAEGRDTAVGAPKQPKAAKSRPLCSFRAGQEIYNPCGN